ncbi:large conductance mechanosensitive channel protein MscL [Hathewaya histolytica]|uniref:Large-conductance mechanosensitive channel n=2 Tax=Hathewaya histolytica TaxID=1498 RepID=MSCL_HATHI|nr:large conductance mechanosensitive channel protein MscL [Hathewaya histolytica]Q9X722.1 RecName: Full=Large-conductance mechanosensitive channel [Hathewaya histolytica]BAA77454.1 mechanosensitive channel [Hathewaya histolytica]VTQ90948.1 large conductance mechanosensitive channel protein [Hathewaya histolytica]
MWKDFKEFAMKGNVVDLAVGVIIGGAFGKIVTSLVNDVIMPILGLILGGINFTSAKLTLHGLNSEKPLTLNYGQFIQNILDFLIISFSIFLFIRLINRFKRKEEAVEEAKIPEISREEELLGEIRDLLKEKNK